MLMNQLSLYLSSSLQLIWAPYLCNSYDDKGHNYS